MQFCVGEQIQILYRIDFKLPLNMHNLNSCWSANDVTAALPVIVRNYSNNVCANKNQAARRCNQF